MVWITIVEKPVLGGSSGDALHCKNGWARRRRSSAELSGFGNIATCWVLLVRWRYHRPITGALLRESHRGPYRLLVLGYGSSRPFRRRAVVVPSTCCCRNDGGLIPPTHRSSGPSGSGAAVYMRGHHWLSRWRAPLHWLCGTFPWTTRARGTRGGKRCGAPLRRFYLPCGGLGGVLLRCQGG